jgi:hypothetical protein
MMDPKSASSTARVLTVVRQELTRQASVLLPPESTASPPRRSTPAAHQDRGGIDAAGRTARGVQTPRFAVVAFRFLAATS